MYLAKNMLTIFTEKFLKFGIVGVSGTVVDFGLTFICKEKFKLNKYIANSIGFFVAASSNYILNRLWTFESHNEAIFTEYSSFIVVSILGLLINNTVIWLLSDKQNLNFYVSKLLAVAITMFWNFFANAYFTFSSPS